MAVSNLRTVCPYLDFVGFIDVSVDRSRPHCVMLGAISLSGKGFSSAKSLKCMVSPPGYDPGTF